LAWYDCCASDGVTGADLYQKEDYVMMMRHLLGRIIYSLSFIPIATSVMVHAQQTDAVVQDTLQTLESVAGAAVDIRISPATQLVTSLAAAPGHSISTFASAQATPEERARLFLGSYGAAFGIGSI